MSQYEALINPNSVGQSELQPIAREMSLLIDLCHDLEDVSVRMENVLNPVLSPLENTPAHGLSSEGSLPKPIPVEESGLASNLKTRRIQLQNVLRNIHQTINRVEL